jgi:hypothetical protein
MIPSPGHQLGFSTLECDFVRGLLLVGRAPNAASLKKLEQLSKRRTQMALLFFYPPVGRRHNDRQDGIGDPIARKRVVSLANTTSIAAPSEMN